MDVEIAAVITVSNKLELLDRLLERRIMRSALDVTGPALPLMNKVYKLGEYRRLAANLKVMEHRISCALGEQQMCLIRDAAARRFGLEFNSRQVKAALKKARKVLSEIGIDASALNGYKALPLFAAECRKLAGVQGGKDGSAKSSIYCAAECAYCRGGRTAQA